MNTLQNIRGTLPATVTDMDEFDIPSASMYKIGEDIAEGSEKFEAVGEFMTKGVDAKRGCWAKR